MEQTVAIARTFQRGAGAEGNDFDLRQFQGHVVRPIRRILEAESIQAVVVVSNGTPKDKPGGHLAEVVDDDGMTPTMRALSEAFPSEIKIGRVISHLCRKWGANPGSAKALNEGAGIARKLGSRSIFSWSPEIEVSSNQIASALAFALERKLQVVGLLRENWWRKIQWQLPQNTVAFWNLNALLQIGDFSEWCQDTGRTLEIEGFGTVPLAGLEEFNALFRLLKFDNDFRWGMACGAEPLRWETEFFDPKRRLDHEKKVARQGIVTEVYMQDIFPELPISKVMHMLFSRYHYQG